MPVNPHTPSPAPLQLVWTSEADTQAFAARLAACAQAADATVTLHGDLGAGKTTFVRHLLHAMGVSGRIKSPTYAVVEPHQANGPLGEVAVWHFDFYRFEDSREWEDAGFRDVFASRGLKLVEWPDKAGPHLPVADLAIHLLTDSDESRRVTLTAGTAHGHAWLATATGPALAQGNTAIPSATIMGRGAP